MLTCRQLLKHMALLTTVGQLPCNELFADKAKRRFSIGACDWSIGKDSNIEAFDVAKQIGLNGIMVNMGSEKNNLHLREPAIQQAYLAASKKTGVQIASVAIGELNNAPYKSDPRTEEWVWDSIDTAKNLGVSVILLAFFSKNDLRDDEKGKKEVIRRLKKAAPKAEKSGIILGIESYLTAAEHLDIMEKVGSKNVKTYIDFRNTADAGYDVLKEVKQSSWPTFFHKLYSGLFYSNQVMNTNHYFGGKKANMQPALLHRSFLLLKESPSGQRQFLLAQRNTANH